MGVRLSHRIPLRSAGIRSKPPRGTVDRPTTVPRDRYSRLAARHVGILVRHLKSCGAQSGRRCNCQPTYQASVWSARDGRRIKKSFRTLAEAKAWRAEAQSEIRRGTIRAPSHLTLREVAECLARRRARGEYPQSLGRPLQAERAPRRSSASSPASLGPRLAVSPDEAAAVLGVSRDYFDEHLIDQLRIVRRGRRILVSLTELERWLDRASAMRGSIDRRRTVANA
jgi:excisionase family DNA binding protein